MPQFMQTIFTLEGLAVVLALAYLLLATFENAWCWLCALLSSALYVLIFWDVNLFMESGLNVFYMVMAYLGWQQWQRGGSQHNGVSIVTLLWWQHGLLVALIVVLALVNGWLLHTYTAADWPFVDSFTTWGSVITTFLVVRKVLENWLYWVALDFAAALLITRFHCPVFVFRQGAVSNGAVIWFVSGDCDFWLFTLAQSLAKTIYTLFNHWHCQLFGKFY